ncbi:MAG TPA: hypothetical protein VF996_00670 [Candidatus Saccharimonadales bacterium]
MIKNDISIAPSVVLGWTLEINSVVIAALQPEVKDLTWSMGHLGLHQIRTHRQESR